MKNQCKQYWPLDEREKMAIEQNCIYVFDTNVLLNLYRYTKESRDNLLNIISHKKNIWLPNRVVEEYGNNRIRILINQTKDIKTIKEHYQKLKDLIRNIIRLGDNNKFFNKLDKEFNKLIENIENNQVKFNDDYLLKQIFEIFHNKVGAPYDKERIEEISREAKERFDKKIPPGYMDMNKFGNNNENIGDLIVWYQIIDFAKSEGKEIIFVTGDIKEDWFLRIEGKTISARYELIKEFYEKTNKRIIIKSLNKFLEDDQTVLQEADKNKLITENNDILGKPFNLNLNLSNAYSAMYAQFAKSMSSSLKSLGELYIENMSNIFVKKNQDSQVGNVVTVEIEDETVEDSNN